MELKKENKCYVVNDASKIKHRSDSPALSWPSWPGSRQTRRRRRRQFRREEASQSCEVASTDRSKHVLPSRSIGQSSNTWSGCGCGQRGNALAPRGHPTGMVPLWGVSVSRMRDLVSNQSELYIDSPQEKFSKMNMSHV